MTHEWVSFLGCMSRCHHCGVRRIDAESPYCKNSDIERKWRETVEILKEQEKREIESAP